MTREEAKMVLCANVMVACDRAGFDECTCKMVEEALDIALEALNDIVQCKDCKFGKESCGDIVCHKPGMREYESDYHPFGWFCADGKRR